MPRTPSDKLYQLIRALTPMEKRYFKVFVRGKHGLDARYLELFDAMDEAAQFDDAKWRRKIYLNEPLEGKKYPELKAYLYDLLLKCLQQFDEQHSVQFRLNHLLQSVAALFKRGHYLDCRDLLAKARKLALEYESFTHQLEIVRWEKQLAYTRMDIDFLHLHLEKLQSEELRAMDQLQNAAEYRRAFFQVYTAIKKDPFQRSSDRIARLNEWISQGIFVSPDAALSHTARVLYYRTLSLYYHAALEQDRFYETGKILIALQESKPHFLRENLSDYIAALSNQILACGLLRKYEEVRECLEKINGLQAITEDDRRKIHRQYFSGFFALCTYTGEFSEARREMERCLREAARFDPGEYETGSFYLQFVPICIGCGDYGAALDYLNHWLAHRRTVGREDLQSLARILQLIIHFELGNYLLLDSQLRTATRFLKRKNRLHKLEQRFMQGISEAIRQPDTRSGKEVFAQVKTDLLPLASEPETRALLQTFDLLAWLDAKAGGQTFETVVRKKYEQESPLNSPLR
ncbi:MAG: hypothetical protein IT261_04525 [Saprospiraceae bacterium]|nr:hypothetical protein [Saprospiraceae bacterium]